MGEDGKLWLGTLIALPWAVSVLAPVNQIAKFLARLEERNPLWRHFDLGASLWIASNAPLSEAGVEASEAVDLNLIPDRRARTMLSNMAQTTASDSFRGNPIA